jgi:hypothetical protein
MVDLGWFALLNRPPLYLQYKVRYWPLTDIPELSINVMLSEVKRTSRTPRQNVR